MQYYINSKPSASGNYGNPQSNARDGALELPEELLGDYIATMGFAKLTVVDGVVTAVQRNEEAYAAYKAEHPDAPEEPAEPEEPEPSAEELINILLGVTNDE